MIQKWKQNTYTRLGHHGDAEPASGDIPAWESGLASLSTRPTGGETGSKSICTPSSPRCRMTACKTAVCKRKSCHGISPTQLERTETQMERGGSRLPKQLSFPPSLNCWDGGDAANPTPTQRAPPGKPWSCWDLVVLVSRKPKEGGVSEGPGSHRTRSEISFTPQHI